MGIEPGTNLGQYRIVEQLGRGGMATVYKAFQPSLDRYVAIKVLPTFYAEEPTYLERFRQEARSIARLRHPNILTVFDFGEQDGITYIVSEFVPGGTLGQQMGHPWPLDQALSILKPVASALDYAHSQGILHRDVKPSNVLMAEDGTPVLSDFGIARMVGGARLTESGVAVGTPEYMSPEQAMGQEVGPPSDIYSLGIILYDIVTGQLPFMAETPMAVILAHLHNPLPLPRTILPDLPEEVEAVFLKALAKQPEDRYQTAREMATGLERALSATGGQWQEAPQAAALSAGEVNRLSRAATAAPSAVPIPPTTHPGSASLPPVSAAPAAAAPAAGGRAWSLPRVGPFSPVVLAAIGVVVVLLIAGLGAAVGGAFRGQPSSPPAAAQSGQPGVKGQTGQQPIGQQAGPSEAGQGDAAIQLRMMNPTGSPQPGLQMLVFPQGSTGASPETVRVWTDREGRGLARVVAGNYIVSAFGGSVPPQYAWPGNQRATVASGQTLDLPIRLVQASGQPGQPGQGQPGQYGTQPQPGQPGQPGPGQPGMQPQPGGQSRPSEVGKGDASLQLSLTGPQGNPLVDVRLMVSPQTSPPPSPETVNVWTDREGRALVRVSAGSYQVAIFAPSMPGGYAWPGNPRVTVASGQTVEVPIRMLAGTGQQGQPGPQPGMQPQPGQPGPPGPYGTQPQPGQPGPAPQPGQYGMQPGPAPQPGQPGPAPQPGQPGMQPAPGPPPGQPAGPPMMPVEVGTGDGTIRVNVTDPGGRPVPGMSIRLWSEGTQPYPGNDLLVATSGVGVAIVHLNQGSYEIGFNPDSMPAGLGWPGRQVATVNSGQTLDFPIQLMLAP